jgi:1-deoxy-D-xylulose-5-phosphate reductoisomerase
MRDNKSIKGLSILGSTGSIGVNTLEIVRARPDMFEVIALSAGTNMELLAEQIAEFRPGFVSVLTEHAASELKSLGHGKVEVGVGVEGVMNAAAFEGVDITVSAIAGAAGLLPTMAAIKAGKDIALANKETLVMAGPLVMESVRRAGVRLMPIDSEHSAVFQALEGHRAEDVRRIILTASGGPFLNASYERLESVTPDEALKHPKWSMGRKITIDSATLMNKGLEVIEARWLFGLPAEKISVVIHPQSVVHSMVEYVDGSIMAQMSTPDMKGPIAYALSYPARIESSTSNLDMAGLNLEFMEPDLDKFPCLGLAYEALDHGGTMSAVLNAADEVAVALFLDGEISFTEIHDVIKEVLKSHTRTEARTVSDVLHADRWARAEAARAVKRLGIR